MSPLFKLSIDIKLNMKLQIIITLLICTSFSQVNHTAIPPKVVSVKINPTSQSVPKQHSFKEIYESLGYEIQGQVFETDQQLLPSQVFNSSAYSPSESCDFYNSDLSFEVATTKLIGEGKTIQATYISKRNKQIFLVVSNDNYDIDQTITERAIVFFTFDKENINLTDNRLLISELGLKASEKVPIRFAENNNVLLVTDGVIIIGINIDNPSQWWEIRQDSTSALITVDYPFVSQNSMLAFEVIMIGHKPQQAALMMAWSPVIKVFTLSNDSTSVMLSQELTPPSNNTQFYDVISQNGNFYALVQHQLVVFRSLNGTLETAIIQLQSYECFWLDKYETTLHIICKEGSINYVAEFYFNTTFVDASQALKLNRYYTQIGDANHLFRFGGWDNQKLLISGGDQLFVTPYGINRQVLLEAKSPQLAKRFRGLNILGIQKMQYIQDFSTLKSGYILGVGIDFLAIYYANQEPAEIECYSSDKSTSVWNVLVQINTTSCPANGDIEQLQSICQISIPYIYRFTSFQVDSSKKTTVTLLVFTILGVIAIVLLGCAFHCKTLRTRAMNELRKKLAKLQKNAGPKPI